MREGILKAAPNTNKKKNLIKRDNIVKEILNENLHES